MTTHRFAEIPLYALKRLPCAGGCGRSLRRQRKFSQTLNPFNKNAAGQPKTADEIRAELREQVKEWEQRPETCQSCTDATAAREAS